MFAQFQEPKSQNRQSANFLDSPSLSLHLSQPHVCAEIPRWKAEGVAAMFN